MNADADRILIQRLAAGELDALEEEQARARIARDPELAALHEQLLDLRSRVRASFPEPPPPPGDTRAFVQRMQRLSARAFEPRPRQRAAASASAFLAIRPRGADPGPGAHLFHLREIQRDAGPAVELEFYAGDLLAKHSEVLLLSAFAGSYLPTPGSVFGAISDRYGISFTSGAPPGATRHPGGLLHFPRISCPAFDSLWVIEMREPGQPFTLAELRSAFEAVGAQLSEMLGEASSITLPLLSTGHQELNPKDVARELLSFLPRWARNPRLRTVRVFTLELQHVAILNRALDDRDFSAASSALDSARRELQRRIEREAWSEPVRAALKDLLQIASAPDPSLRSIALEGRRIAELVQRLGSREEPAELAIFSAAAADPEISRAELATSQLQLLLAHGRAAAAGNRVEADEAAMILYAAIRAAELARS